MNKRHSAFTLVEILVVLAIIAILAALLFPAFGRARESARQTNCASNLQQIGIAVLQYKKDEGRYPDTLVDILGENVKVADAFNGYKLGGTATGYLKGGQDLLVCPDDDTLPTGDGARSSYGSLSKNAATGLTNPTTLSMSNDFGQYVWNYWGTRPDGFSFGSPAEVSAAFTASPPKADASALVDSSPSAPYNPRNPSTGLLLLSASAPDKRENNFKYSMSNRFAPPTTIITHCVYHRLQTANSINFPGDLYIVDPQVDGTNAKDIILRVDGSAKAVDVTLWNPTNLANNLWQKQTP